MNSTSSAWACVFFHWVNFSPFLCELGLRISFSQSLTSQDSYIFLVICHHQQYHSCLPASIDSSSSESHNIHHCWSTPFPKSPTFIEPNCCSPSFCPSFINSQTHPFNVPLKVFPLFWRERLYTHLFTLCWGCFKHCLLPLSSQKFSWHSLMSSAFLPFFTTLA